MEASRGLKTVTSPQSPVVPVSRGTAEINPTNMDYVESAALKEKFMAGSGTASIAIIGSGITGSSTKSTDVTGSITKSKSITSTSTAGTGITSSGGVGAALSTGTGTGTVAADEGMTIHCRILCYKFITGRFR